MVSTSQFGLFVLVLGIAPITCNAQCGYFEFRCDNGDCAQGRHGRCDGKIDCSDNSDEYNCGSSCIWDPVCDDGQCCFGCQECDGIEDCLDGSDEDGCPGEPVDPAMIAGTCFGVITICLFGLFSICICGILGALNYQRNQQRAAFQPPSSRTIVNYNQQPPPSAPSSTILTTPGTDPGVTFSPVDAEAALGAEPDPAFSVLHCEEPPTYPGPPQEMFTPAALRKPDEPPPYHAAPPPSYGSHLQ